jgi:hypothetical protein
MIRSRNTLLALSLCAGLVPGAALAADNINGGNAGPVPLSLGIGTAAVNAGRILCTAAINANGTIATTLAGSFINSAARFGPGLYGVAFRGPCGNVQSINGWFRIVEPDTLTTGSTGARYCTVADLAGNPAGVFIECFNSAGGFADTSFTLSVSR